MANSNMYHERQSRQLCALHAINNLLQEKSFSQKDLDLICYKIMNPHKSPLGLGNYDINVIMAALQSKGLDAIWFDHRKDPSCLNPSAIKGFIINVPNECAWYNYFSFDALMSKKHWISIIKNNQDSKYYNLDSKLMKPKSIGTENDLLEFLRDKNGNGCEIFLVVDSSSRSDSPWFKS